MMTNRIDTGPLRLVPPPSDATGQLSSRPAGERPDRRPACAPRSFLPLADADFVQAHEAVRQAPEVRAERIAVLRQRIAAGTYYVPDALLARRILDSRQ